MKDESKRNGTSEIEPQEWQQIKDIFLEVLEKPPLVRPEFLTKTCGGQIVLRQEVEKLLDAHFEAENFIETPVGSIASVFQSDFNQIEKQFGNYKIVSEIGRGGMGAVFLVERNDGEFHQQAALKVLRQSLPDAEVIRYFKREREILASLNHPFIARLLDGGVTTDGLPYFVMEYVEGVSVLEFARRENISVNKRLRLFLQICTAVSFAHKNLIVHRDIKPSNILVREDGTPKLLDFGLAKIVDTNLIDENQTQTAFRALTPAYASPEQTRGENVTTATDIYSLGVVLAELVESRTDKGQTTKDDKQNLKGDLKNIVAKSLREEPERRYESVEAFAEDITRHLNGLPVAARPNTFRYRAGKFVKRNSVAVVAAFVMIFSLLAGLVISMRQTNIALAQERKALREAEKSKKITAFMEKILNYANPAWYAEGSKLSGRAKLIEVLDDISDKIETEFPDDLDVQAELHHKATEIYQANGNYPKSLRHAERALEIRRALFGDKNVEVAKDKYYLGAVYLKFLKVNQSLKLHEEAAATFREIAPDNANLPFLLEDLGGIYRGHWREFDKSEKNFTEALEIFRQKDGEIHFNTVRLYFGLSQTFAEKGDFSKADEYFREGANRLNQLPDENIKKRLPRYQAAFEQAKGNGREAEKILEDFLAQTEENAASPDVKTAEELLEQFYGANENYEKSIELQTKLIKNLNPNVLPDKIRIGFRKTKIALDFYRLGKNTEADAMFAEGYEIYRTVPAENFKIEYDNLIAECFVYQKRGDKAKPILEELLAFFRENLPPNHGQTLERKKLLEQIEIKKILPEEYLFD